MNHLHTFSRTTARLAASSCAATIAILGCLTACSGSDSTPPPSPSGVIEGRFLIEGGPAPGAAHPIPGTVMVHGPSQRTLTVGADGRFRVRVTDGVYTLSAQSKDMSPGLGVCQGTHPVTVRTNQTVRLDVVCQIP